MDGAAELDLSRPRGLAELLSTTLALFGRHSGLFFSVTLIVVVPVFLLVDGVWGGTLRDGANANPSDASFAVSSLLSLLAVPAFVTALHAVIVRDLGRGIVPSPVAALRESGPRLLVATVTVMLYTLATAVGFVLLIVPGIWLAVRLYFGAQAAVLDQTGPMESLDRSAALVKSNWWETARALVVAAIVFGIPAYVARSIINGIDNAAIYVALEIIVQAVLLSVSALFGTLLFFSLRAQRET